MKRSNWDGISGGEGEVHGIRVVFKDKREFDRFNREGELEGSK